jgi:putative ABC transport system ATP-binding protein
MRRNDCPDKSGIFLLNWSDRGSSFKGPLGLCQGADEKGMFGRRGSHMKTLFYSDPDLTIFGSLHYPAITIEKSSFTFITGPSGCGKSTYLRLLNQTLVPDKGQIFYKGKILSDYPVLQYRQEVLRVPQEPFLFDTTIAGNFQKYYETLNRPVPFADAIREALELACLSMPIHTDCRNLSGGERQRVFLALFLSLAPKVLLLDEPTASLDENTAWNFLTGLKKHCRKKGITPLCVCHQAHLVKAFADEVIDLGGQK